MINFFFSIREGDLKSKKNDKPIKNVKNINFIFYPIMTVGHPAAIVSTFTGENKYSRALANLMVYVESCASLSAPINTFAAVHA